MNFEKDAAAIVEDNLSFMSDGRRKRIAAALRSSFVAGMREAGEIAHIKLADDPWTATIVKRAIFGRAEEIETERVQSK